MRVMSRAFAVFSAMVLAPCISRSAEAQGWPEVGVLATAGLSAVDGRSGMTASAGLSRRWGPIVGSIIGDVTIFAFRSQPALQVDPVNGTAYCGNRAVANVNTVCSAAIDADGGVMGEAAISLDPLLPFVVGVGHRLSPVEESYATVMLHGETPRDAVRWTVRGSLGAHFGTLQAGIVVDLDLARP